MSMVAGEFVDVYGREKERGAWGCVVTCFFLDTAANVLEYIDVVQSLLKPGGVWVHRGPLTWHWQDLALGRM